MKPATIITQSFAAMLCTFIVYACNNKSDSAAAVAVQKTDSLANKVPSKDTPSPARAPFVQDPFIDINRFDTATGNHFIDSIYKAYYFEATVTGEHDLCLGDACHSYKKLENPDEQTTLYMVKTDCSEYGFGNDQFLLKNDSLIFARNFNVQIKEWPTEKKATQWLIEEKVYRFNGDSVTCYVKNAFTQNREHFDYTLKNITPALITVNAAKSYAEHKESLHQILTLKEQGAALE